MKSVISARKKIIFLKTKPTLGSLQTKAEIFKTLLMEDFFKNIITILLSVATVAGLIIWAVKEIFKKILQVDNERQKNKLLLQHQKYTKLQNEQFDTLKTIYVNLIRTDELVKETFVIIKDGQEFSRKTMERTFIPLVQTIFDTNRHFKQNSIFLTETTTNKIAKTIDSLFFCLTNSSYAVIVKSENVYDEKGKNTGIQQKNIEALSEAERTKFFDIIKRVETVKETELKEAINFVQAEFREIFGVR